MLEWWLQGHLKGMALTRMIPIMQLIVQQTATQ
jgi:hypothetical protein